MKSSLKIKMPKSVIKMPKIRVKKMPKALSGQRKIRSVRRQTNLGYK